MSERSSLLEAFEEHVESIIDRDLDRFAATLASADVRVIGGDGRIIEGKENVVASHRDWFMDDTWKFEPEVLWIWETAAAGCVLTRVTYSDQQGERQFLLFFLLAHEDGEWRVVYDQNTPIS